MNLRILILVFIIWHANLFSQIESKERTQLNLTPTISFTIGGNFFVTGTFKAYPNERVDELVSRIIQMIILNNTRDPMTTLKEIENYPTRDIILRRSTGEIIKIDLEKFRLTGDFTYNPYIKNDDVIIFPYYKPDLDFIRIEGAVKNPKRFQYMEGDKIEDAIILAQGLDPNYEKISHIEIYRLSYDGLQDSVIKIPFDLKYPLKRGDRIRLVGVESQKRDYVAYIAGEVFQPGTIMLPKDGLPLQRAIEQVGGLRESADLSRAELIRGGNVFKSPFYSEYFEELMMRRMANIKEEDSLNFIIDNRLRFLRGVAAYDFNKLKVQDFNLDTLIVQNGDYIFIPPKVNLVYVFGQVNNFGYVPYVPGKNYSYYIEQAGGLGKTAKKEVYVIKSKSRAWLLAIDKNVIIEPGDFIWVPKKPIRDFDYYVQRIGFIGSIVTGIVTTLILLLR